MFARLVASARRKRGEEGGFGFDAGDLASWYGDLASWYGDLGMVILSGGFETRPYRGSFNVGVVMPNHVYGIVVMVGDLGLSYWHGHFLHYRVVGAGFKPAR